MEKYVTLESIEFEAIETTNKNSLISTYARSGVVNVKGIVRDSNMTVFKTVRIEASEKQALDREWAENLLLNSI